MKIKNQNCFEFLKEVKKDSVDLVIIDPPYFNKGTKPKYTRKGKKAVKTYFGEWDIFKTDKEYLVFINNMIGECNRVLKEGGSIYIFCNDRYNSYLRHMLKNLGMEFKATIVWHKYNSPPRFIMEAGFISSKELILFAHKEGKPTFNKPKEFKEMLDVWITTQTPAKERTGHPTQKPLSLIRKIIEVSSNKNDLIMDCFLGSGTTAVACKQLGRDFIGCDVEKEYIDISNKRLAQEVLTFTNNKSSL
tara:strand:- start:193 stop:933 length:741 start_codon:yes stop_codon:yes gene_type:complete